MKPLKWAHLRASSRWVGSASLLILCLFVPLVHAADEKKDAKKTEPPRITMAIPFGVTRGATNKIIIRGLSLTNATQIRFLSSSNVSAEIKSRGKANLADKADPKKFGDTQVEVAIVLPPEVEAGDLPFLIVTPDGDTNTNLLRVVERQSLLDEKEPNAGFRKPNDVAVPQIIRGMIQDANDVDVFRFRGKGGQTIAIESQSARYGSSLDALVMLYDAKGHILATSDDAVGLDARITQTLARDGEYFFSVNDAHDRGGASYTYLIELR
jgi:hypothetical protein